MSEAAAQNEVFVLENGVLLRYQGCGGAVRVPEGVTSLAAKAFFRCQGLQELTLPEGLREIGQECFAWCAQLRRITLPDSLRSIGALAFCRCEQLEALTLPPSLERIGDRVFAYCTGLRTLMIPAGVTELGDTPLLCCSSTLSVTVSKGNPAIRCVDNALLSRDGSTLLCCVPGNGPCEVPAGVTRIRDYAFQRCTQLTQVILPAGVKEIGAYAFQDCSALAALTLPEGLEEIGRGAFARCQRLTGLTIPDSVERIGRGAFEGCSMLRALSLPPGVEAVEPYLFERCEQLRQITLPPGVRSIGAYAFCGCVHLEALTLPEGLRTIGDWAFLGCKDLSGVALPQSLEELGSSAFRQCSALREVTIPEGVKAVGQNAFADCAGLETVTVPDPVDPVGLFSGCGSLSAYRVFPSSRRYRTVDGVLFSADGTRLIAWPPGRRCERYDIPSTVREVCDRAFAGARAALVVVPPGVERFSETAAQDPNGPWVAVEDPSFLPSLGRAVFLGDPNAVPRGQRRKVLEGFLFALRIGLPELRNREEACFDYLRREQAACLNIAWNNEEMLHLMMELHLLPPETVNQMIHKYSRTGRTDLLDALRACREPSSTT